MTPEATRRLAARGAFLAALALVVVLAVQVRSVRAQYADLAKRFREPHSGMYVPTFRAAVIGSRDSLTVGRSANDGRQVLFAFTTTCPFCRASLPSWARLAAVLDTTHGAPVQVVGITLSQPDSTRAYAAENGLRFPIVRFPEAKLGYIYRLQTVPATEVLDSAGRVLYAYVGVITETAVLDSVLAAVRFRTPLRNTHRDSAVTPHR